jgi:hypothetical protein
MKFRLALVLLVLVVFSTFVSAADRRHEDINHVKSRENFIKECKKVLSIFSSVAIGGWWIYNVYSIEPVKPFTTPEALKATLTGTTKYMISRGAIVLTTILSTFMFVSLKKCYLTIWRRTPAIRQKKEESLQDKIREKELLIEEYVSSIQKKDHTKLEKELSRLIEEQKYLPFKYADARISLLHALISSSGVFVAYAWSKYNNVTYDPIFNPTVPSYVLAVSSGFFMWELISQIHNPNIHGHIYTAHAIFGICLTFLTALGLIGLEPCYILGIEFSSIFLNINFLLEQDGRLEKYATPLIKTIVQLTFAVSFIALRGVLIVYASYRSLHSLNSSYELLDHLVYPMNENPKVSPQLVRQVIFYTICTCVFLLLAMNYQWGILLIFKIIETIFPSRQKAD